MPVPVDAKNSARQATTIAGEGFFRSLCISTFFRSDVVGRMLTSGAAAVNQFALSRTRWKGERLTRLEYLPALFL